MGDEANKTTEKTEKVEGATLDITPAWAGVVPLYIDVLKHKYNKESVALAQEELVRMGALADKYYDSELMWTANEGSKPRSEPPFSWEDNARVYVEIISKGDSSGIGEGVVQIAERNLGKIARVADKYVEYAKSKEKVQSKDKDNGIER